MPCVILTGASSGIGHALARILAAAGYDLGLMARRSGPLEALRAELPVRVTLKISDFSNPENAAKDFEALWDDLGNVDGVILNAGVNHRNEELDWAPDSGMIDVNVRSFVALADAAGRRFLKSGRGHITGISSIAGVRPMGKAPVYGATKAFVSHYLAGLRQRLAAECSQIYVTDIRPGYVDTAMIVHAPVKFWVAPPEKAAAQILSAIRKKKRAVYVTHRWAWVAFFFQLLPEWLVNWGYAKFAYKKFS